MFTLEISGKDSSACIHACVSSYCLLGLACLPLAGLLGGLAWVALVASACILPAFCLGLAACLLGCAGGLVDLGTFGLGGQCPQSAIHV